MLEYGLSFIVLAVYGTFFPTLSILCSLLKGEVRRFARIPPPSVIPLPISPFDDSLFVSSPLIGFPDLPPPLEVIGHFPVHTIGELDVPIFF